MRTEIFVTGGAGFVGSQVCREFLNDGRKVVCFDNFDPKTTNPATIAELRRNQNFRIVEGDIRDLSSLRRNMGRPDAVVHTAAVSSVDRSIRNSTEAIAINGVGTLNVFEAARHNGVDRVHYVSTDEVFGHAIAGSFDEESPSAPRNPYGAGKLMGEAIATAWTATYGMEATITNSVNNFGPYQAPEKLIPRLTVRGIQGNTLPVYGDGQQIREWLYVTDHARAIRHVLEHGSPGERYCVGTGETTANIDIVKGIVDRLGLAPDVIEHVEDRRGHDVRYAVNATKIQKLGWQPHYSLREGLGETVDWYKNNRPWWEHFIDMYPDLQPVRPDRDRPVERVIFKAAPSYGN